MRGLMIDYVRRRRAKKRGGEFHITSAGTPASPEGDELGMVSADSLERLSAALDVLTSSEPDLAQLVDLHFFGGFTFAELAELQGVSERTGPPTMAERPAPHPVVLCGRPPSLRPSLVVTPAIGGV